MWTRVFLIASLLSISACAAVDIPEVGTTLRDMDRGEGLVLDPAVELPEFQVEESESGQICIVRGHEPEFDAYTAACQANSEALEDARRGVAYLNQENGWLLAAGRAAEESAELYRGWAVSESNRCRLVTAGAGAAGGFLLLVLGLGAAF